MTAICLLEAIGFGKISANQIVTKVVPEKAIEEQQKREKSELGRIVGRAEKRKAEDAIKVNGVGDILIRYAKCCNPIPGDEIVGYITRGRGVTVHTADCPVVSELDYSVDRKIDVDWDTQKKVPHSVTLSIHTEDKPGVLSNVSSAVAECDVNISQANIRTTEDKKAYLIFTIEIYDLAQLQKVIKNITQTKWVLGVERVKESYHLRRRAKG